jgi:hypothetical protein
VYASRPIYHGMLIELFAAHNSVVPAASIAVLLLSLVLLIAG